MNKLCVKIKVPGLIKLQFGNFIRMFKSTCGSKEVFHYRILHYLRENTNYVTCVQPELTYNNWKLNSPNSIKWTLYNIRTIELPSEFKNHVLDVEHGPNWNAYVINIDNLLLCYDNFSVEIVLKLLDILIHIVPNITKLKFYTNVTNLVEFWLKDEQLQNTYYLVQFLFFISLSNSSSSSRNIMQRVLYEIDRNIERLTVLRVEDIVILTNCFYRTSVRIKSEKVLNFIADNIENHLSDLLQDEALFIALLKPLKSTKYHNRKLLAKISQEMTNNNCIQQFPLMAKTHLMSLYNDSLYYDDSNFISVLLDSMKDDIARMPMKDVRLKDVSTFLWTLSYLGINTTCNDHIKTVAVNKIESAAKKQISYEQKKYITSMLLSMWILKWNIDDIIKAFVTSKSDEFWIVGNKQYVPNFHLLQTCLTIEAPHLIKHCTLSDIENHVLDQPNIDKRLAMRFFLQKVLRAVQGLAPMLNLKVQCVYNIPYIWICAIRLFDGKSRPIYVEVLDNSTCLRGTNIPNGLMMLKLRLERKLQWKYILVDYMDSNYEELENLIEFIDNEIKKIILKT